jgi:hypothetical protein
MQTSKVFARVNLSETFGTANSAKVRLKQIVAALDPQDETAGNRSVQTQMIAPSDNLDD